jgi:hypothetical protein
LVSLAIKSDPVAPNLYQQFVNPQWVKLLEVLQMNLDYRTCRGVELITGDGRTILDFNSGYCVHNIGHNHQRVVDALKHELDAAGPAMLQNHVPDAAGLLAARLCDLAGGRLRKVFFASSGSEGIEAVIKFARAHTKRAGILYAAGGFHGLTCGALSLMSDRFWRNGFGPLLVDTAAVPFGDLAALERALGTRSFAAYVLEPIQAEGRRHPAATRIPAGGTGALPALRHPLRARRGADRFLPHGAFSRGATIWRRARPVGARQSAKRRSCPVQRRPDDGAGLCLGFQLVAARNRPHLDLRRKCAGDACRPRDARRACG